MDAILRSEKSDPGGSALQHPVGIGPVIAGHDRAGQPVYYVDIVFRDGSTSRITWPKRGEGADRVAKNEAYRQRILLANQLRPHNAVLLAHDLHSFESLVAILSGESVSTVSRLIAA